jgi:hypothetical protein
MVCDTVNGVTAEYAKKAENKVHLEERAELEALIDHNFAFSTHSDAGAEITEKEFLRQCHDGSLTEFLDKIDFPAHFSWNDCFVVLDSTGQGRMTKTEFVDAVIGGLSSSAFQRDCDILLDVHRLRRGIVNMRMEVRVMHQCLQLIRDSGIDLHRMEMPTMILPAAPVSGNDRSSTAQAHETHLNVQSRSPSLSRRGTRKHPWDRIRAQLH